MMWKIVKSKYGLVLVPSKELGDRLLCPFCAEPLVYHHFVCFERKVYPYRHCDIMLKCPTCEHAVIFGVSTVSEEDVKRLKASPLHNKVLDGEKAIEITKLFRPVNDDVRKVIDERMRTWGYW